MHYVEQKHGDILVLSLKGKLAGEPETEVLYEKITNYLKEGIRKFVMDLKHVHWLSSMGIGSIMRCTMTIRTENGDMRLTGLSDKVQKVFDITHLVGVIQVYDSPADAINSYETERN